MLRKLKYKLKNNLLSLLVFIIIMSVFFIVGELVTRNTIGNRLIVEVESSGMHHFEPNQFGWYGHDTVFPARINNLGARGDDVNLEDLEKKRSVVFLGDSYTFGWRVKDEETFSFYFDRLIDNDNVDVMNFGMGGFGLDHLIANYKFNKNLFKEGDIFIVTLEKSNFYVPLSPYKTDWKKELFWEVKRKSAFISYIWARFSAWKASLNSTSPSRSDITVFSEENKRKLISFNNDLLKNRQSLVYIFLEHNHSNYSIDAERFCLENTLICITDIPNVVKEVEMEGKEVYTLDGRHNSRYLNEELSKHIISYLKKEDLIDFE